VRADTRGTRIYPVLLGKQRIGQAVTTTEAKELITRWAETSYGYLFYDTDMNKEKRLLIRTMCLDKLAEEWFNKEHIDWYFTVEKIKEAYSGQGIEVLKLIA
jgi:hypothetical protein